MRESIQGLSRYIATVETSKHRFFVFLDASVLPDNKLIVFGLDDAFHLGILSSYAHSVWALAMGGRLGVGNDPTYQNLRCFDMFPFPEHTTSNNERIRILAEQLDAHRKRQQELHPKLTMTGMYNVLEKLREGEPLSDKEQTIHEQGLVSVLKQIHDDLDAAVCEAYGWPVDIADEDILQRLVDLNHQRAAEEAQGHIRWLRPEFQNPDGQTQKQIDLPTDKPTVTKPAVPVTKQQWPSKLPDQMQLLKATLEQQPSPLTAKEVSDLFKGGRGRAAKVEELLETLTAIGQARQTEDGRFAT
ncbi:MAG: hypothetical protein KDA86_27245 [Planctomycetaceae bacterium]|nr:hypothetical protein [Planctomycetaceae bacterium]